MLKVTVKSSGNFEKKINELRNNAAALKGQHQVAVKDLLTPEFVSGCSSYASLDDLFAASPFKIETLDHLKAIPDAEWDAFIAAHTSFSTWEEMQQGAMREYVRSKLGFK